MPPTGYAVEPEEIGAIRARRVCHFFGVETYEQ
jgi:hypothetical protein